MTDFKALAERLEEATYSSYLTSQEAADLRAAAQLARKRAEAPEPVGYMRPDELAQANDAPRMCRVHPAKDRQADMVPVFTYPPAAQPQREPTYLDPTAVALGLAWSEDGQADSVEPTEYIYIRLKRPEGYEDVHPDLLLEDAHIHPAFEAEIVSEPTEAGIEEYEILCNDEWVASASGAGARADIAHYLTQYEQDGPCEVYAVTRRLVDRAALAAKDER